MMRKLTEVKIREILSDYWVLQDDCEGMENGWVVKELARLALLSFQEIPARITDIHLRSPLEVEDIWRDKFKAATMNGGVAKQEKPIVLPGYKPEQGYGGQAVRNWVHNEAIRACKAAIEAAGGIVKEEE